MAEADSSGFRLLMLAANSGNTESYARLLRELSPVIRRIVRTRCRSLSSDAVEDVVQDVLVSVHAARATYDPDRPFMPWLVAIARRRIIDAIRREIRRGAREQPFDDHAVTFAASQTNTPDEEFFRADALRAAIAQLPRGQRLAIELLKLREMSLAEASVATGSTVGALKVATHRAMTTLRARLKKT